MYLPRLVVHSFASRQQCISCQRQETLKNGLMLTIGLPATSHQENGPLRPPLERRTSSLVPEAARKSWLVDLFMTLAGR